MAVLLYLFVYLLLPLPTYYSSLLVCLYDTPYSIHFIQVFQFIDDDAKLMVISIRGTQKNFDVVQDADIWAESVIVQLARSLLPLGSYDVVTGPSIDKYMGTATNALTSVGALKRLVMGYWGKTRGSRYQLYYFNQIEDIIRHEVLENEMYRSYAVVLTGHSLGGGLAGIVAARLKLPAVTFSAPGLYLARSKLSIPDLKDIDDWVTNVVPMGK